MWLAGVLSLEVKYDRCRWWLTEILYLEVRYDRCRCRDEENCPQHNMVDLYPNVLLWQHSRQEKLFEVDGNTRTHTHTPTRPRVHTHTHTHTH